jgi:hypothetical protein
VRESEEGGREKTVSRRRSEIREARRERQRGD